MKRFFITQDGIYEWVSVEWVKISTDCVLSERIEKLIDGFEESPTNLSRAIPPTIIPFDLMKAVDPFYRAAKINEPFRGDCNDIGVAMKLETRWPTMGDLYRLMDAVDRYRVLNPGRFPGEAPDDYIEPPEMTGAIKTIVCGDFVDGVVGDLERAISSLTGMTIHAVNGVRLMTAVARLSQELARTIHPNTLNGIQEAMEMGAEDLTSEYRNIPRDALKDCRTVREVGAAMRRVDSLQGDMAEVEELLKTAQAAVADYISSEKLDREILIEQIRLRDEKIAELEDFKNKALECQAATDAWRRKEN